MEQEDFYTELFSILDENGIIYEDEIGNREKAIKILIELKRRKAKNYNKVTITDDDIVMKYVKDGMIGIKKMFNRNDCYLYDSDFVFSILFYHYQHKWNDVETLIQFKLFDYE
tara:strand:+ start:60 stop:398 length:339 start_codon:yes stop_codon:yes gene_type:complete